MCASLGPNKGQRMSIKIMSHIWEYGPDDKHELLVLLALADYSNDKGESWPSVASIARKSRLSVRGVQTVCTRLIASKWLRIDMRKGRSGSNRYFILTPAAGAPRSRCAPQPTTPDPAAGAPNPAAGAGKPSEPLRNNTRARDAAPDGASRRCSMETANSIAKEFLERAKNGQG